MIDEGGEGDTEQSALRLSFYNLNISFKVVWPLK